VSDRQKDYQARLDILERYPESLSFPIHRNFGSIFTAGVVAMEHSDDL
jgi:hypothetical protein